jgi:hypothetical protein
LGDGLVSHSTLLEDKISANLWSRGPERVVEGKVALDWTAEKYLVPASFSHYWTAVPDLLHTYGYHWSWHEHRGGGWEEGCGVYAEFLGDTEGVREDEDKEGLMDFLRYTTLGPDQYISMLYSVRAFGGSMRAAVRVRMRLAATATATATFTRSRIASGKEI